MSTNSFWWSHKFEFATQTSNVSQLLQCELEGQFFIHLMKYWLSNDIWWWAIEGQLFIHLMKSWLSKDIWWWAGGSIFHPPDEILTIRMIVEIWTQKLMSWRVNFSATWWNIDYQAIYGDELEGQLFINLMKYWLSANTYGGELEGQFFIHLMKSWPSKEIDVRFMRGRNVDKRQDIVDSWSHIVMSLRVNFSSTWWNFDYQRIYDVELRLRVNVSATWWNLDYW